MQYVYAAMWFVIGIMLVAKMGKENKIFYVGGGFFFLFGLWWLANAIWPEYKLFEGTWGIVLRVVTAVVLVWVCIVYFRNYKKDTAARKEETKASGDKKDGE